MATAPTVEEQLEEHGTADAPLDIGADEAREWHVYWITDKGGYKRVEVVDCGDVEFTFPGHPDLRTVQNIARLYCRAIKEGERRGRTKLQWDLHRLLDIRNR